MTVTQTLPSAAGGRALPSGALSPRTRAMLEGAIVPTLLRLVAGNLTMIVTQAVITLTETYYISWLGADALAGATLVFPLVTLMLTISGAGIGGGVASAIARSLGAGRRELADALGSSRHRYRPFVGCRFHRRRAPRRPGALPRHGCHRRCASRRSGPAAGNVVGHRALGQDRAVIEIDEGEGTEIELLNESVRPVDVQKRLMLRHWILLVARKAAKVPKLGGRRRAFGADLESVPPILGREPGLMILIFEIDADFAHAVRPGEAGRNIVSEGRGVVRRQERRRIGRQCRRLTAKTMRSSGSTDASYGSVTAVSLNCKG
jgi:MatE